MHDPVMERGTLAVRHDFDMLPRSAEIDVQPAQPSELSALADMANRLVPGVRITEPDLERYFTFDPESILTFSRKKNRWSLGRGIRHLRLGHRWSGQGDGGTR